LDSDIHGCERSEPCTMAKGFLAYLGITLVAVCFSSGLSAPTEATSATPVETSSSAAAPPLFGTYFANWAQYRTAGYAYVAKDLGGIVQNISAVNYMAMYFCPPAGYSPMPYWALPPYGNCDDASEFEIMSGERALGLSLVIGLAGNLVLLSPASQSTRMTPPSCPRSPR